MVAGLRPDTWESLQRSRPRPSIAELGVLPPGRGEGRGKRGGMMSGRKGDMGKGGRRRRVGERKGGEEMKEWMGTGKARRVIVQF